MGLPKLYGNGAGSAGDRVGVRLHPRAESIGSQPDGGAAEQLKISASSEILESSL